RAARDFLTAGGASRPDGHAHARRVHRAFVARNLSPGGSADLLGAACWLQRVCAPTTTLTTATVAMTAPMAVAVAVAVDRSVPNA
ncbi:MAG: triphosphoribosyl-dephospho-CoA synthase, partial [Casimicrobiaceae bacterium]